MIVGSQLKNAQVEVVAAASGLPTTDLALGRIIYVKDVAQLYIYDGAWKPIYTKEDADAAIAVVNAAVTSNDTDIANIINGTTTLTGGTVASNTSSISTNTTNVAANTVLAKKTSSQTGSFLWTAMGPFSQEVVIGDYIDGFRTAPWAIEIIGMSVCQNMSGSAGAAQTMTIMLYDGAGSAVPSSATWSSGLVISNNSASIDTVADYLDSNGDLDTSDLNGDSVGGATMPTWDSASELSTVSAGRSFGLKVTANAIDGTAKVINDVSIQIFWRRR